MIGRVWMTTTQEMASRVLKDNQVFTLRKDDGAVAGMRWWMPSIFRVFAKNMLTVDEPDHSRLRGIVEEAFRRRPVLDMTPRIRAIADQLADELFGQASPADLVVRYARALPLSVICELLGLPLADRPKFMAWANRATSASSALVFLRMVPTLVAIKRYLQHRLEHARAVGGQGLLGADPSRKGRCADKQRRDGRNGVSAPVRRSRDHDHLISGSVFELAKNPGLRDWLAEDWSKADLAVEEFLRFVSSVQFSKPRFIRQDVELGGVRLKRGDQIVAMLAAANLDPAANTLRKARS